jgi:hypothetical protein
MMSLQLQNTWPSFPGTWVRHSPIPIGNTVRAPPQCLAAFFLVLQGSFPLFLLYRDFRLGFGTTVLVQDRKAEAEWRV